VNDEIRCGKFHQAGLGERCSNPVHVDFKESKELAVGDISGGDQEET